MINGIINWLALQHGLCSAKILRQSCSTGHEAVLVVKSVEDRLRRDLAWSVESMPMMLRTHAGIWQRIGKVTPKRSGRPRL
jgi:hypothetical protein